MSHLEFFDHSFNSPKSPPAAGEHRREFLSKMPEAFLKEILFCVPPPQAGRRSPVSGNPKIWDGSWLHTYRQSYRDNLRTVLYCCSIAISGRKRDLPLIVAQQHSLGIDVHH